MLTLEKAVAAYVEKVFNDVCDGETFHQLETVDDLREELLFTPIPFNYYDEFLQENTIAYWYLWNASDEEYDNFVNNELSKVDTNKLNEINIMCIKKISGE